MMLLGIVLCLAVICVMLLGFGELGKEVVIECQCFGVEVIVVDCYVDVLVMYVVYCFYVINMFDGDVLCCVVELEKLYYIVLEIEVIVIDMLI